MPNGSASERSVCNVTPPVPRCPDCEGEATLLGPIPATDVFAGRVLDQPLPGGHLYRCQQCSLGFRWPRPGKNELDAHYEQGSEQAWTVPVHSREDWAIARGWVEQILPAESRILDVGCFDGGFLEPLVESHRCYGIEIHPAARDCAERKGIKMIGSDFSEIAGTFDCVAGFDVIEHVERPKSFLDECLAAVKPGGWVLLSTGNLDAFTFRLMGSRYWYCTIAEHVSFVSPAWISQLADRLDYRIVRQAMFAHGNQSWSRRTREAAKNLLYRFGGPAAHMLRMLGMGGKNIKRHSELADHPPTWLSASDHFMVLIQKR
jgi:SAM-dependent methyltransferase